MIEFGFLLGQMLRQPRSCYVLSPFNGLRWLTRTGIQYRMMPNDLPAMYQQTQRWLRADVFEALVRDLHMLLREMPTERNTLQLLSSTLKLRRSSDSGLSAWFPAYHAALLRQAIPLRCYLPKFRPNKRHSAVAGEDLPKTL